MTGIRSQITGICGVIFVIADYILKSYFNIEVPQDVKTAVITLLVGIYSIFMAAKHSRNIKGGAVQ